jgi:hypothetical protein
LSLATSYKIEYKLKLLATSYELRATSHRIEIRNTNKKLRTTMYELGKKYIIHKIMPVPAVDSMEWRLGGVICAGCAVTPCSQMKI